MLGLRFRDVMGTRPVEFVPLSSAAGYDLSTYRYVRRQAKKPDLRRAIGTHYVFYSIAVRLRAIHNLPATQRSYRTRMLCEAIA